MKEQKLKESVYGVEENSINNVSELKNQEKH